MKAEAAPDSASPGSAEISLRQLFLVFFRIGLMSVGGGSAGWIHREAVTRRKWMTNEEFLAGVAFAQVLPGVNTTNITVYVGHRLRGWIGAASALCGFLFAPFWFAIVAAVSYHALLKTPGFDAAMVGVAAVALGMVLRVGLLSAKRCGRSPVSLAMMAAAFVSVGVLHWPLLPVILVLAPISIYCSRPREPKHDA